MPELQKNGVVRLEDTPDDYKKIVKSNLADSPLLQLSPELRNSIFRFAVDTPTECVFLLRKRKWVVTSSHGQKIQNANPLQNVCKLMRAETRRLEMKENEVKVDGDVFVQMRLDDDWRLRDFSEVINTQNTRGISLELHATMLHDFILRFASENQEGIVKLPVTSLSFALRGTTVADFLSLGWIIEKEVRGLKKRNFPGIRKVSKLWKGKIGPEKLTNLKFRPIAEDFLEDKFKLLIQQRPEEKKFVQQYAIKLYGSEDALIAAVRKWYKNGV